MRNTLHVTVESDLCALVSGYGAREVLTELRGGRPPIYSATSRAWVTTAATAVDVIAAAESRGWRVVIEEPSGGDAG